MIPIKNAREIEKMRQACRTASDILDRVRDLVRPGITTKEVDEAAADFMSEARVKSAFLGRARICWARCGTKNARGTADSQLRQARQRSKVKSRHDAGN